MYMISHFMIIRQEAIILYIETWIISFFLLERMRDANYPKSLPVQLFKRNLLE